MEININGEYMSHFHGKRDTILPFLVIASGHFAYRIFCTHSKHSIFNFVLVFFLFRRFVCKFCDSDIFVNSIAMRIYPSICGYGRGRRTANTSSV